MILLYLGRKDYLNNCLSDPRNKKKLLSHLSKTTVFMHGDENYVNQNGEIFGQLLLPLNLEGCGFAM